MGAAPPPLSQQLAAPVPHAPQLLKKKALQKQRDVGPSGKGDMESMRPLVANGSVSGKPEGSRE